MIDLDSYRASPNYRHGYEDGLWAGVISGVALCVIITIIVRGFA